MWFWLVGAILCEVTGTVSLRFTEGFTRLGPSVVTVVAYGFAFWMLSRALAGGMAIGVAYGIWAALGVALVAVAGVVLLGEGLTWVQVGGILLVIAGVVALELGGSTSHAA